MGAASARDVASRTRRASSFVDPRSRLPDARLFKTMDANLAFKELNLFVRSQLKRAVKLYREYLYAVPEN